MDATPPSNLPPALFPVFFLLTSLFSNTVAFLVFRDGKFHWLVIHDDLLRLVKNVQDQLGSDEINWEKLCIFFMKRVSRLFFYFGQSLIDVEWKDVLFPRRIMMIMCPDGRVVPARYKEHFGEMWSDKTNQNEHFITFEVRGTSELFTIPITDIITHIPSRKDIEEYDQYFEKKKLDERMILEEKQATETSEAFNEQMRERSKNVGFSEVQRYYPNFSQETLRILFLLCRRFNIVPDFTYQFNLIVLRLLPLGDQSRFPLQQLSEENQEALKAFEQKYDAQMVGRVIKSKTGRFQESRASSLPDHLRRLLEYYCLRKQIVNPSQKQVDFFLKGTNTYLNIYFKVLATNMSTKSGSALTFPDSYWTQPEFGVVLKNSKNTMLQSLFKMPSSFPPDVFV